VGIRQIVFSSSCATYGVPQSTPIPEEHSQNPISAYGESKFFAERLLHWHASAYGLQYVALRYFNAAGADPRGELGEEHDPETHLIPLAIRTALGQEKQLQIFGTDFETRDGTAIRDYIHVCDLADGHVVALRHLEQCGTSEAINLGTGRGVSVRDVVRCVERVSGERVPVAEMPRRAGDPAVLVADARKAKSLLGWRARRSDLKTIVQTAWNWHAARVLANESVEALPVASMRQAPAAG
jgi:UDP-glucose-4-epimerase GalE